MPKRPRADATSDHKCPHTRIFTGVSPDAALSGFTRVPEDRRRAASTPSGRVAKSSTAAAQDAHSDPLTFPAPLVLDGDDLASDPNYPPQSLRSWMMEKERNPITKERKTLYVVAPPEITREVESMRGWADPKLPVAGEASKVAHPAAEGLRDYLEAFYHGMDVKMYRGSFKWVSWDGTKGIRPGWSPQYVGLQGPDGQAVRIRCRVPDDEMTHCQVNLNDILDALLEIVPEDAYSIMMLVHHDIYEGDGDMFCGGRAYGGSRIAVVSSFRYSPKVDTITGPPVPYDHIWPAAHCADYVAGPKRKTAHEKNTSAISHPGAMTTAVRHISGIYPQSASDLSDMWQAKVAKTASHELGHCLGLDHCVYYACVMQGASGLGEDDRQPPFLCPVCLSKVTCGILGTKPGTDKDAEKEYAIARYKSLQEHCSKFPNVTMFAGFRAWLETRILQMSN